MAGVVPARQDSMYMMYVSMSMMSVVHHSGTENN